MYERLKIPIKHHRWLSPQNQAKNTAFPKCTTLKGIYIT